jgi:dihydrofolate reductase
MRDIVNSTFVSLDGVVNHMERWHFDFIDDESDAINLDLLRRSDAMVMGRKTYEAYAGAWPGRTGEIADRINAMTKYVASSTLQEPEWANTQVLTGDLVDAVGELKAASGQDILMHGYGPVAKELVRHKLLDELWLWVHPVLAGVGDADDILLGQGVDARLTLSDVKTLRSGIVILVYTLG